MDNGLYFGKLCNLPHKCRRGSKPRCHLLTHGSDDKVTARLTKLISPWGVVSSDDKWMPKGFDEVDEAQLDKASYLLPDDVSEKLKSWWTYKPATTPNWDIASTCRIEGKNGLLLVEAKAHDQELISEKVGKNIEAEATETQRLNHARIGDAIEEANIGLNHIMAGWKLSRDSNYQMSNRFAWAWKLTELGIPVILVYLGFTHAVDMCDRGNPFIDDTDWQQLVRSYSEAFVPPHIWNSKWIVSDQPFIPLIRTL